MLTLKEMIKYRRLLIAPTLFAVCVVLWFAYLMITISAERTEIVEKYVHEYNVCRHSGEIKSVCELTSIAIMSGTYSENVIIRFLEKGALPLRGHPMDHYIDEDFRRFTNAAISNLVDEPAKAYKLCEVVRSILAKTGATKSDATVCVMIPENSKPSKGKIASI